MTMITVDDLARDLKVKNEDLVRELVTLGFEVQGPESPLETDDPDALRAQLVDMFPQREVVEKRIKPTVIRRRTKPNQQTSGEPSFEDNGADAQSATQANLASAGDARAEKDSSASKKPLKRVRKPEPARILEIGPRPDSVRETTQPKSGDKTVSLQSTAASDAHDQDTGTMQEHAPKNGEGFASAKTLSEPQTKSTPKKESGHEPARIVAEAPKPPQGPGSDRESRGEAQRPSADDRNLDAKRKKKKDKRMQPAQIIGKVELRKEPVRETPVERSPEPPTRPTTQTPSPMRRTEPQIDVQQFAQQNVMADYSEEDKRKKAKKKEKKPKEGLDEKIDEGRLKRRKEVILKSEIYDDRSRPSRLRGRGRRPKPKKTEITMPKAIKRRIKAPELITVANLAHKMSVKASDLIQQLLSVGVAATINQAIDFETASLAAAEFGYEVESTEQSEVSMLPSQILDTTENLVSRSPVVTVMGHVDHGKTSLLDAIRSTHVTDQEAGGITQHIGAYKVKIGRGELVFLDTPGHEAFTAMRARGAQVTDFVILVVAADDGVMDQTVEAINHSKAAGVPIIVAVNKIDKPEADRDRVLRELSEHGLIPESWGGDTLFAYVSAKTGEAVEDLLDLILLQAEMMELKANPDKGATGTVVEARLDKGKGPIATVLVKEGTLKLGDPFVAGFHSGKVRAMLDDSGKNVETAGPATPVEVHGFSGVPEAGEIFLVVEEERVARQIVEHRLQKQREHDLTAAAPVSLENLLARMNEQPTKELNLIVKADVQGSVEALKEALTGISAQEIKIKVIHSGVGAITESDVMLARASSAIIIGFNVRPTPKTAQFAEQEKIDIRLYTIIYEALDDIRNAMEGMLAPIEKETVNGRAEVRQTFHVPKIGMVAGCYIVSGKIERSNQVRLIRDNVVVYTGKITSMKRFKEDVREALEGYECGIGLENYKDIKVGDIIEAFFIEHETAKLTQ